MGGLLLEIAAQRPLSAQTQWILGVSVLIRNGRLSRARSNSSLASYHIKNFSDDCIQADGCRDAFLSANVGE